MTVLVKFPAQVRPLVGVRQMMMMVNVTRQRMMPHKGNKGQGHKMEPDLRCTKIPTTKLSRLSQVQHEERNRISESFTMSTRGKWCAQERQLPRLRWKEGSF